MAWFSFRRDLVKRGKGRYGMCVASRSAYHSAQKIQTYTGRIVDFTDKEGVLYSEISLPSRSPAWAANREELWRRLELRENRHPYRATAVLAHNLMISLPDELTIEQNIFLVREFVREQFLNHNFIADWSIHAPDPRGDQRNIHFHLLVPLRQIEKESFGIKLRCWGKHYRNQLISWRMGWAQTVNRHLEHWHHTARIDDRSLRAQGIKRLPKRLKRSWRPKIGRAEAEELRGRIGFLPLSPIIRLLRKIETDGTIYIRASIQHSALNELQNKMPPLSLPILPSKRLKASPMLALSGAGPSP